MYQVICHVHAYSIVKWIPIGNHATCIDIVLVDVGKNIGPSHNSFTFTNHVRINLMLQVHDCGTQVIRFAQSHVIL